MRSFGTPRSFSIKKTGRINRSNQKKKALKPLVWPKINLPGLHPTSKELTIVRIKRGIALAGLGQESETLQDVSSKRRRKLILGSAKKLEKFIGRAISVNYKNSLIEFQKRRAEMRSLVKKCFDLQQKILKEKSSG